MPKDFEEKKKEYYELLKQPSNADDFIKKLKLEMAQSLNELNKSIPNNSKVKVSNYEGGRIIVSPSEAQNEPINLTALKSELMKNWSMINLLDILKETDYLSNFTEHFKSSGIRETLDKDTRKKVNYCIICSWD